VTAGPASWDEACQAKRWGTWRKEWPLELLQGVQEWGDANCCRFVLTPECNPDAEEPRNYWLVLYVAPKPQSRSEGINQYSVMNRDRAFARFSAWFEGYLVGKGVMRPTLGNMFPE
jgi:hypothetical protein